MIALFQALLAATDWMVDGDFGLILLLFLVASEQRCGIVLEVVLLSVSEAIGPRRV